MYAGKHIEINSYNVKQFNELNKSESLTAFVNNLIGAFCDGKLIELSETNYEMVRSLSSIIDETKSETVNKCLSSAIFDPPNKELPVIFIDDAPVVKSKKKRRKSKGLNQATTY